MDTNNLPQWSFGDRIRKIRRDRHMTQDQFAARIGTKGPTLDAWEQGRNRPKDVVELAQTIEAEFGVPAAWTLGVLSGRRATDDPDARAPDPARRVVSSAGDSDRPPSRHRMTPRLPPRLRLRLAAERAMRLPVDVQMPVGSSADRALSGPDNADHAGDLRAED